MILTMTCEDWEFPNRLHTMLQPLEELTKLWGGGGLRTGLVPFWILLKTAWKQNGHAIMM
jgi:hypothetical protein